GAFDASATPVALHDDVRVAWHGHAQIAGVLAEIVHRRVDGHDVVLLAEREARRGGDYAQPVRPLLAGRNLDVAFDHDFRRVGTLYRQLAATEAELHRAGFAGIGELDGSAGFVSGREPDGASHEAGRHEQRGNEMV